MSAFARLAWLEFSRSFRRNAPDGRDFLSLTLLIGALVALGCALLAAQDGITRNFTDTLLGRIEGAGSPIRVSASNRRLGTGIDAETLARIRPHIAHPVSEAEPGLITFPGRGVWSGGRFEGAIVAPDNPLWLWAMDGQADPADPLTLVLDRRLAGRHLSLDAYRHALADWLPPAAVEAIPDRIEALNSLYLLSRINTASGGPDDPRQGVAPTRYRIVWVDSFPSLDRPAFLMPAPVASGLMLGERAPGVAFDPALLRAGASTVSSLRIFATTGREALLTCLGPGATGRAAGGGDLRVDLAVRLPGEAVAPCLAAAGWREGIDYRATRRTRPAPEPASGGWRLACDVLAMSDHAEANRAACTRDPGGSVVEPWFARWDRADVYVEDRADILAIRDGLMRLTAPDGETPLFAMSPLYAGALGRLGYLLGVIDWIAKPVAAMMVIAGAGIVFTSLLSLVVRRRRHYGLMLARGMPEGQITGLVCLQVLMALAGGAVLGLVLAEGTAMLVSRFFAQSDVATLARDALGQRNPVLIAPLTSVEAIAPALWRASVIAGVLGLIALRIAVMRLRGLGVRRGTPPMELLQ